MRPRKYFKTPARILRGDFKSSYTRPGRGDPGRSFHAHVISLPARSARR